MKNYLIPVKILAVHSQGLLLELQDSNQDCPRCKAGEGCGNFPWFQGFSRKNTFFLSGQKNNNWQQGDLAQMILSSQAINFIALLTYGLPLLGFLLALSLSQSLAESKQILLAVLAAGLMVIFSQVAQNIWIKSFISLEKREEYSNPQKV